MGEGGGTTHRAAYILERGVWRATCRACGWEVSDRARRSAAARFRVHITDVKARLIDLTRLPTDQSVARP